MCRGLQMPQILRGFLSLPCCVLHRIALPVVSEWYQESVDYTLPVPLHIRSTARTFSAHSMRVKDSKRSATTASPDGVSHLHEARITRFP
jgi:hypothetical protein